MFPCSTPLTDFEYSTTALAKLQGVSFTSYNVRSLKSKLDDINSFLHKADLALSINKLFLPTLFVIVA